ncbi:MULTISPECIES: thioredoxin-dependent thiol peroxidase [Terrabacteria group]|uniref:thioredoxin-dependent thiol peroxidase n=1 Tax=Bacillati TaxID=1783272 RepID=UPI001C6E9039|nr:MULTISPECIES: thioredoxin-dependent thiol peroxidase [Terrabacteria group]MBW9213003.1 thioredoxin-dependent thiol peroxidase [Trueperella sp. zg.1013]
MLAVGTKAPAFELLDQDSQKHCLDDYKGKKVILYFYPKDNTSGCTSEACGFKDNYPQFQEKGTVILGVSKDSVKSHKKFQEAFHLPFTLLSDPDLQAIRAYEVWVEKSMYGRKYMGIERSTYLINEEGIIEKTFQKVKPKEHSKEVLEVV